jgi:hypothetical protein
MALGGPTIGELVGRGVRLSRALVLVGVLLCVAVLQALTRASRPALEVVIASRIRIL